MSTSQAIDALAERFRDLRFEPKPLLPRDNRPDDSQWCVRVVPERLLEVMTFLRDDPPTRFEQLAELTCVDYLDFPGAHDRFGVIYGLVSVTHGHRLWVKCFVNDPDPEVPSVTGLWKGADWQEREVYDLFGIRFTNHPDLRRILTWEQFEAHPLRKDYPLRGRGEREAYDVVDRQST